MLNPTRARRHTSLAVMGLALALVLVACQGTPATPGSTAAPSAKPVSGGTARIGLPQEPASLNPYLVSQGATTRVLLTTLEGLIGVQPDGEFFALLARDVPTPQNGGVSADGRVVTYKLRDGVKWSDGQPLTSSDVQFTWQAIMATANKVVSRAGYDLIDGVDVPDALTVVVRYKQPYAPYLTRFPYVLPKHVLGALPDMNNAPFNRKPVGTGPFMVTEWVSGDRITMTKNPNYRVSGQPYLDGITFLVVPSREAGLARIKTGDLDVLWDLTESSTPEFKGSADMRLTVTGSINVERLVLNLAKPGNPAVADQPHPILGDVRVRKALQAATDIPTIATRLYEGQVKPTGSVIHAGWAALEIKPPAFDPTAAKRLLDEAGWVPGADGIRVKAGQRMVLIVNSTAGDKARELLEQVLQEQWKAVGIQLDIKNLDSTALLAPYASSGPRARGNFDMLLYSTGADVDPDAYVYGYFHSSQIPTEANKGAGSNFSRYINPKVDAALTTARTEVDQAKRKVAYAEAQRLMAEDVPHLLLFVRQSINAFRTTVRGDTPNPWLNFTWDTQNWWKLR